MKRAADYIIAVLMLTAASLLWVALPETASWHPLLQACARCAFGGSVIVFVSVLFRR